MMDHSECDVLVVGSGAAGLSAALVTAVTGLKTLICEKEPVFGGTSAWSGGAVWAPANSVARRAGLHDDVEACLTYLAACLPPEWMDEERDRLQMFANQAGPAIDFIMAHSPLRFENLETPDLYMQAAGARYRGRMLTPCPLSLHVLGRLAARLRRPDYSHLFTFNEILVHDPYHHPWRAAGMLAPALAWRVLRRQRAQGSALVGGLMAGCQQAGARLWLEAGVDALEQDGQGRVVAAYVDHAGRRRRVAVHRGVVLATGGFERDEARRRRHFPPSPDWPDYVASPPGNTGDGHVMAERAGARLHHMDQANLSPAIPKKDGTGSRNGAPSALSVYFHRDCHAILIGPDGHRFVDEQCPNMGEVIASVSPSTATPSHVPAWCIGDSRLLRHAPVLRWYIRGQESWFHQASSISGLARLIGVSPAALQKTVQIYNQDCLAGQDRQFGRDTATLCRLEHAPYVAIPFARAFVSTKGGPMTNVHGQVERPDGSVIPGLYCAGVAMANPLGTRAVTLGTTLGPNLTWGYICGTSLCG